MSTPTPEELDATWQSLQDALALEETPPEEALPEGLEDSRWADEEAFYEALATSMQADGPVEAADAAVIEAALEAVPVSTPGRGRVGLIVALVVAAAAAVLLWTLPTELRLEGQRGTWTTEGGVAMQAGDVLPEGDELVATQAACLSRGDAVLCARDGARLTVDDAEAHAVTLRAGAVDVQAGTWRVSMAGAEHRLGPGDHLAFAILASKRPEAEPLPPAPEPEPEPTADTALDDAPAAGTGGPLPEAEAKRPSLDAATLLERARTARGAGNVAKATRLYRALVRQHPRSSEAKAGRVTLGQLELGRGRAKAALRQFEAYLRAGGPLAEEAAWGKIQALDRLGRTEALEGAIEAFLTTHPRSVYRGRAKGLRP
ncbi:MAG: tetratricopeptide repeat protein [Myxococcota bacterium]